jgi:hypothetical protein
MRNPLNSISGTCLFYGGRFVLGDWTGHNSNPRAEVSHNQANNFLQMWFRGSGDTMCPLVFILPVALAPSVVLMLLQNWHAVLFSQRSSTNALHLASSSCVYHLALCAAAELDDAPLLFFQPMHSHGHD